MAETVYWETDFTRKWDKRQAKRKTPGRDEIFNELLKSAEKAVKILAAVYQQQDSVAWSLKIVYISLLKKKDSRDCQITLDYVLRQAQFCLKLT